MRYIHLRQSPHRLAGFTLIELIVVMALMAMASLIVIPQLWGQYDSFKQRQQVERFWNKVKSVSLEHRINRRNFIFHADDPDMIHLANEDGLVLLSSDTIIVRVDGFTRGGRITLKVSDDNMLWNIDVSTPDGVTSIHR